MFQSIGGLEILTIGVVAVIVFGPQRLPEIAKKVGGYVRDLRSAANEIKSGLDAELREIKEPLETFTTDLTKPVSEVKETLAETADMVKRSADATSHAIDEALTEQPTTGDVQWIGPEPTTGVSPAEAWEGMDDPVPPGVADEPSAESSTDEEPPPRGAP